MMKIKLLLYMLPLAIFINCIGDKHQYPLNKRYWDINDYDDVVRELNYNYDDDEKLPSFDNPETSIIVRKLTDEENFKIVLDDEQLGLRHRNDIADKFFARWRDMNRIYDATDRKDQFLYDKEMLSVWHFGLGLQLKYFKLGNEQILERADDPNSSRARGSINSNVGTLISNYTIYLDLINNEKAYTEERKIKIANGIDKYFPKLINLYPNSSFKGIKTKAELMLKKSKSKAIKSSLEKLIQLIDVTNNKKNNKLLQNEKK